MQVQEALRSNKYVALRVANDRWVVQRRERGKVWRITLRDIVANVTSQMLQCKKKAIQLYTIISHCKWHTYLTYWDLKVKLLSNGCVSCVMADICAMVASYPCTPRCVKGLVALGNTRVCSGRWITFVCNYFIVIKFLTVKEGSHCYSSLRTRFPTQRGRGSLVQSAHRIVSCPDPTHKGRGSGYTSRNPCACRSTETF